LFFEKKSIGLFYIYTWFSYVYMFSPVWILFLLEHHFTMSEIGLIDAIYWLAMFIFQIPAGYLSDRYPRTYMMCLSSVLVGIGAIVFAFPVSFSVVVLSYIIWACGIAFKNVGDAAWLFDYMHMKGMEKDFTKIYGIGWGLSEVAIGVSAVIGGYIGSITNLQLPILISGFLILFSAVFPLAMPCSRKPVEKKDFITELKTSASMLRQKKILYILLLIAGIYFAFDSVFIILKQPFLYKIGLNVHQIGLVYLIFTFIGALGSVSIHKIDRILGYRGVLLLVTLLPLLSILMLLLAPQILGIAGVVLVSFTTGITVPLMVYYINLEVGSERRGLIMSYMSVIYTGILIPATPFVGYLADISLTLAIFALLPMLCIPLLASGIIGCFGPLRKKAGGNVR